ncbi:MAG TPA: hypothetical protein VMB85_03140 [Bryobacteraceae bacterium]|nr:hypothetical protein [Bryobacteraceae bacterium]
MVPSVALAMALNAFCSMPAANATLTNGENAVDVLGQYNSATMADNPADYVKSCVNDGASPYGFNQPSDGVIDSSHHRLFIVDSYNNRVLVYTLTSGNLLSSKTPANVIGQPDFMTCNINSSGSTTTPSAASMYNPSVVTFDSANNLLYVADAGNNRVLVFSTATIANGMNASYELGQPSGSTAFTTNANATTQSGLYLSYYNVSAYRAGLALDITNQLLYVSDADNNRVLVFPAYGNASWAGNGENASYELGQAAGGAAFTTTTAATTQSGLNDPAPLALDATNQLLYVGDAANQRVMVFPAYGNGSWTGNGENASYEIGQPSGANAFTTSGSTLSQSGFGGSPTDLAFDSVNDRLFVADTDANRVMVFPAYGNTSWGGNGENALDVIGQVNFTSDAQVTTQSGLDGYAGDIHMGVAYDSTNQYLYVMDVANNRVMIFNVSATLQTPSSPTQSGQDACAIANGQLYCWGANDDGEDGLGNTTQYTTPQQVGSATNWTAVSQGYVDASGCGIAGGALYCWGQNSYGEDGLGNTTQYTTPQQVPTSGMPKLLQHTGTSTFTNTTTVGSLLVACGEWYESSLSGATISDTAGNSFAVGVGPTANANLFGTGSPGVQECWYAINNTARASDAITMKDGSGNTASYVFLAEFSGVAASSPVDVTAAATGNSATPNSGSATTTNANDLIFGAAFVENNAGAGSGFIALDNDNGNLDEYMTVDAVGSQNATFTQASGPWIAQMIAFKSASTTLTYNTNWTAISQGGSDACGIAGGALYCWGANGNGEDGLGNTTQQSSPAQVGSATNWTAVSQGNSAACGIAGGALYCWGANGQGQLGLGNTTQYTTPQQVGSATNWTAVSQGYEDTCGIAGGKLYCWGANTNGELGLGNTTGYTSPQQVGSATNWTAISILNDNEDIGDACGIDNGNLYCWGLNNDGEDGLGNTTQYKTPQQVGSTTNWTAVSEGYEDTCGVAGNQLYCWGNNHNGEDGLGNTTQYKTPQPVGGLDSIGNGESASDLLGQYTSATSTATVVWTQSGPNNGPNDLGFYTANGFGNLPVAVDGVHHRLFVTDGANNRVLVYTLNTDNSIPTASGGHTASYVLGQTSLQGVNAAATTVSGLSDPIGLAYDSAYDRLFVADYENNRVLVYSTSTITNGMNAAYELGQPSGTAFTSATAATTQAGMHGPSDVAYDAGNTRLFVADTGNNRVTVYSVPTGTSLNGENAITTGGLLGQTSFTASTAHHTQTGMDNPSGVAYDQVNQRLFVTDQTNNRVTVYNVATGFTNGENATDVLGQTSFTASGTGDTQSTMHAPNGCAWDANNQRLFVVDAGNHRVLVFNAGPSVIATNSENASFVLGQANFTNGAAATTQSGLFYPGHVAYDAGSGRVFVGDSNNGRVMIFEGTAMSTKTQSFFIPGYE